jgi:hypothetical protein
MQLEKYVQKQFHMSLKDKLQEFFGIDEAEVETMMTNIQTNLNSGIFKFVVLMDSLHRRLKDLILFMNRNSQFDIYAVELEYYKHKTFEIIIPKMFGTEVKKEVISKSSGGARRKWNKSSLFEEINNKLKVEEKAAIKTLFDWAEQKAESISYGTGNQAGSFIPRFPNISLYAFIVGYTDGRVRIQFWGFDDKFHKPLFDALKKHISDKSLINQIADTLDRQSHRDLPAQTVSKEINNLIDALDEFIENFKSS